MTLWWPDAMQVDLGSATRRTASPDRGGTTRSRVGVKQVRGRPRAPAQSALIDDDRRAVAIVGTRSPSAASHALAPTAPTYPYPEQHTEATNRCI